MATQVFMKDKTVSKYYTNWIDRPTALSKHVLDEQRFYKFVKACVEFAKHNDLDKKLDMGYLRLSLYNSLQNKQINDEYRDEITHEIVAKFELLRDYEATAFP